MKNKKKELQRMQLSKNYVQFGHENGSLFISKKQLKRDFVMDKANGILTYYDQGYDEDESKSIKADRKKRIKKMEDMIAVMYKREEANVTKKKL